MTTPSNLPDLDSAMQAAATAGRDAGIADGEKDPPGVSRSPYPAGTTLTWLWLRWYVRSRRLTIAARLQTRTPPSA